MNDCILRVNDLDCRDVERRSVLDALRHPPPGAANSQVSLVVRRRRCGRKYQAVLHLGGGPYQVAHPHHSSSSASPTPPPPASHHGLSLDLGVYVARIQPGSAAAREGSVAVGDRLLAVAGRSVERVADAAEALRELESAAAGASAAAGGAGEVSLTLARSSLASQFHALSSSAGGGPLSSSSSGHNMHEPPPPQQQQQHYSSPRNLSAATSPIKDTIRGSQVRAQYPKSYPNFQV